MCVVTELFTLHAVHHFCSEYICLNCVLILAYFGLRRRTDYGNGIMGICFQTASEMGMKFEINGKNVNNPMGVEEMRVLTAFPLTFAPDHTGKFTRSTRKPLLHADPLAGFPTAAMLFNATVTVLTRLLFPLCY